MQHLLLFLHRKVFCPDESAGPECHEIGNPLPECFRQGNGLFGDRIVVAPKQFLVIGVGTNQGDAGSGLEGQDVVAVLQQDDRLLRHFPGQRQMLRPFHDVVAQVGPRLVIAVQFTQPDAGGQQAG